MRRQDSVGILAVGSGPASAVNLVKTETSGNVVAVVDVQWLGSLPTFHMAVVEGFLDLGCRVVSFSPKPELVCRRFEADSDKKMNLVVRRIGMARTLSLEEDRPFSSSDFMRSLARRFAPSWVRARRLRSLALRSWKLVREETSRFRWENQNSIAHVVFPYLDYPVISLMTERVARLPDLDRPWSGLWVHPDPRAPAQKQLRSVATNLESLPMFTGFWSLDEGLPGWINGRLAPFWLGRFPDVTDENLLERRGDLEGEIVRMSTNGPVVLLAGELSARKGVYELLRAAREAKDRGSRLQFVVAGPLDQASCDREVRALRSALEKAPGNVRFLPGWIPDGHEFNACIRAASVVWVAYRGFPFSSNLLTKASMMERPVLVSDGGLLADRVRAHDLGQVVDATNAPQVVSALEVLSRCGPSGGSVSSSYFNEQSRLGLPVVLKAALSAPSAAERLDKGFECLAVD